MATFPQLTERTAQVVSQAMVAKNISRRKLSELADISYGQLGRKLSGRVSFDLVELYAIARALNIAPWELLPAEFVPSSLNLKASA